MIDIYARTFRIATFLDSEETVPDPAAEAHPARRPAWPDAGPVAVVVMAACHTAPAVRKRWERPTRLAEALRRLQDRYDARRSAATLGRLTDDDLRDMGLTRADAERILFHPTRH